MQTGSGKGIWFAASMPPGSGIGDGNADRSRPPLPPAARGFPPAGNGASTPPAADSGAIPRDRISASPPGYEPPAPPQQYDRFGWPIVEDAPPAKPASSASGAWELLAAERERPQPASPPQTAVPDSLYLSNAWQVPPADPATSSGALATPPGTYAPITESGRLATTGRTGQFPTSSAFDALPVTLSTGTGGQRTVMPPDAGTGTLLNDRIALLFIGAGLLITGGMIAFIALRYSTFPEQIALHFGPAGSSQPDRIGERRELWTMPFLAGIVLAANTALAWVVYHYDRFAARLLALGCSLVALVAWIVLLTLINR